MTTNLTEPMAANAVAEITLAGGALGFNWLPVFVAERSGMFARRNLKVGLKRMGSVDKATAAVRSGEADLAITPPEGAVSDFVSGGELRIIAGNVSRLPLSLVANPRLRRIEDLKGCVLGTSSLTEGTSIYTREILSQHGLNYPDDYDFAAVGVHPARWQALQEGRIDAAVQLIPLNFVAFDAGYTNLGEASDYIPEIVFTAMIGRAGWLEANRSKVAALIDALREATATLYDSAGDDALLPIIMETTQSDRAYAQRSLDYLRQKSVFDPTLTIPPAALSKTLELMVKAGLLALAGTEGARAVFDASFVQSSSGTAGA